MSIFTVLFIGHAELNFFVCIACFLLKYHTAPTNPSLRRRSTVVRYSTRSMLRRAAKSQLKWCGQATFSPASVRRYGLESVTKKALIRDQAFIDGEWRNSRTAETFAVTDPANTSTLLADVADCNDDDTRDAIAAANRAFEDGPWRTATTKERSDALRKWASLMHENVEDLAKIMTLECGKPLAESRGEVAYAASFFDWFAEQARRDMGTIIPQNAPGRRLLTIRQPVGVAAAITPWNFPAAMITRKVAPVCFMPSAF